MEYDGFEKCQVCWAVMKFRELCLKCSFMSGKLSFMILVATPLYIIIQFVCYLFLTLTTVQPFGSSFPHSWYWHTQYVTLCRSNYHSPIIDGHLILSSTLQSVLHWFSIWSQGQNSVLFAISAVSLLVTPSLSIKAYLCIRLSVVLWHFEPCRVQTIWFVYRRESYRNTDYRESNRRGAIKHINSEISSTDDMIIPMTIFRSSRTMPELAQLFSRSKEKIRNCDNFPSF